MSNNLSSPTVCRTGSADAIGGVVLSGVHPTGPVTVLPAVWHTSGVPADQWDRLVLTDYNQWEFAAYKNGAWKHRDTGREVAVKKWMDLWSEEEV